MSSKQHDSIYNLYNGVMRSVRSDDIDARDKMKILAKKHHQSFSQECRDAIWAHIADMEKNDLTDDPPAR